MTHRSRSHWSPVAVVFVTALLVTTAAFGQQRCWIEFRDKGPACAADTAAYREAGSRISEAAVHRRLANGAASVTECDVRLYQPYLDTLYGLGVTPVAISRWSNACSAELSPGDVAALRCLPFVKAVHPVAVAKALSISERSSVLCGYDPIVSQEGQSIAQLQRINAQPLMAMGLDATGVRLGFMDTGFRWRAMTSFGHARIEREYDYVFHDSTTANEASDVPDQDNHGSSTLSTAIGYEPGMHASAAFGADVFLAKTEDLRSETNAEEDNMAQALEDMEAWGVDVTSSSLGYLTFDSGSRSYSYGDLNGKTSIAARAAERAASLGVLVVTAMGNSGDQPDPHMLTPADADSILSVGGLDEIGNRAAFSSIGPTADRRIKPDICAPGVGAHAQAVDGHYDFFGGTSYSTPLVSSACCLIKQAHPGATATRIRDAVRTTGSNAAHPDTLIGWGEINAYRAALEIGDIMHEIAASYDTWLDLCVALASESGIGNAYVEYSTRTDGTRTRPLFLVTDSLIYSTQLTVDPNTLVRYRYVLTNGAGRTTYLPDTGYYQFQTGAGHELVIDAYPNPVAGMETIASNEPGQWTVYDATGRNIRSGRMLFTGEQSFSVSDLASGSYFIVMHATTGAVATRKIFVLH